MVKRCPAHFTLAAMLVLAITAAQGQFGIRVTFLDLETTTLRLHTNLLVGADLELSPRTCIGLDVVKSILTSRPGYEGQGYIAHPEYSGTYRLQRNYLGLQYRSHYFFAGGAYIATTVGIRLVRMTVSPDAYYSSYSYSSPYYGNRVPLADESGSKWLFPAGLRFGYRNGLHGFFNDLYFGIGHQFGNKMVLQADYLEPKDIVRGLWINLGYAMGLGFE